MRRLYGTALLAALLVTASGSRGEPVQSPGAGTCPHPRLSAAYSRGVHRALLARRDVWGEALLRSAGGPTYAHARRYVKPLLFAEARVRSAARRLTPSGVYYLPFGQPHRPAGAGSVALHVADGSEIVSERADGPALTVGVGRFGGERYGSCLARLGTPALAVGWLPILATRYVDSSGARYRQESFGVRIPQTRSLVSFVRLTVVGGPAATTLRLRLRPSVSGISASGDRLMRAGLTYLFFTPGARVGRSSLAYSVPAHAERTIYLARLVRPARSEPLALDETAYERARSALLTYWSARLAQGTTFVVPERRVLDAERNLLIQNLVLAWRYSVGNAYQEFSFPESIDAAEVMGEYGFQAVDRSILRAALGKRLALYPDLEIGEKLLGSALYSDLYADPGFVGAATTVLRRYVRSLERQLHRSRVGLLPRERYSSDLPDSVYGLNSQAVIWQGLRLMASVWARTGHPNLARTARTLAARLGLGLRRAVRESERWLPDGSLFVPVKLLDGEQPYGAVTESKAGSYWNLTMPYALASRLFPADGRQARGVLRYLLNHGSRLLGLVRAGAYTLYGDAPTPTGGTDQVYGVNVSRFLADNHQPGQLALSLYGQLAGAMTPQTFVAGEAASVAPIRGEYFRRMYLPPNSVANASFLETLRLMLIHETSRGLELGYATPRAWLQPGRRIVVRGAPTRFGRVSLSVESLADSVRVQLDAPRQARLLSLRLRLPGATGIAGVTLNGRPFRRFGSESVDLSGRAGMLSLLVRTRRRP